MTGDDSGGSAGYRAGPESVIGGGRSGPARGREAVRKQFVDFADAEYHPVVRF
jgi:hypothetical protein